MEAELITAEQLADKLQVSADTVRDWAKAGKIPEIRLSQKVRRFVLAEVLAVLRAKQGAANA